MNKVTIPKTFEEKMKERIKDSIGDLISDEDLSKLVARSMEEVFFSPSKVKARPESWSNEMKDGPSFMNKLMVELMGEKMEGKIQEWMDAHPDEIIQMIDNTVKAGLGMAMLNAIDMKFQHQLSTFQVNVNQMITQSR
jgi:hypothetical protein